MHAHIQFVSIYIYPKVLADESSVSRTSRATPRLSSLDHAGTPAPSVPAAPIASAARTPSLGSIAEISCPPASPSSIGPSPVQKHAALVAQTVLAALEVAEKEEKEKENLIFQQGPLSKLGTGMFKVLRERQRQRQRKRESVPFSSSELEGALLHAHATIDVLL